MDSAIAGDYDTPESPSHRILEPQLLKDIMMTEVSCGVGSNREGAAKLLHSSHEQSKGTSLFNTS